MNDQTQVPNNEQPTPQNNSAEVVNEPPFDLEDWKLRYQAFQKYALEDQRNYYQSVKQKHDASARQVNRIRAVLALMTGISSASAALLVQIITKNQQRCPANPSYECITVELVVIFLTVCSVVLPALAALFNSLADLYQWDRLKKMYHMATFSINYAETLRPRESDLHDTTGKNYRERLVGYAEATLGIMSDEQTQWGEAIRTPEQINEFVEEQLARTQKLEKDRQERLSKK